MHAVTIIVLNICCRRLTQLECTWLCVTVASNNNNNNNKWRSLGIVDGASLPFLSLD